MKASTSFLKRTIVGNIYFSYTKGKKCIKSFFSSFLQTDLWFKIKCFCSNSVKIWNSVTIPGSWSPPPFSFIFLVSCINQGMFLPWYFFACAAMPACDMADNKGSLYLFPLQLRTKGSEKVLFVLSLSHSVSLWESCFKPGLLSPKPCLDIRVISHWSSYSQLALGLPSTGVLRLGNESPRLMPFWQRA